MVLEKYSRSLQTYVFVHNIDLDVIIYIELRCYKYSLIQAIGVALESYNFMGLWYLSGFDLCMAVSIRSSDKC